MSQEIIQLNLEGELCPYPLILSLKKYNQIKEDINSGKKILEIITDCVAAIENIPFEYKKRGFNVNTEKVKAGTWKITIKK